MSGTINPEDYAIPDGISEAELAERLTCPITRICNLYWIEDPDGNVVQFTPNGPQCEVIHAVYIEKEQRIAIPKARAIGFSTLIAIILLDRTHFAQPEQTIRAAIIDQTATDAEGKLGKVRFAYTNLPEALRDAVPIDNKGEMTFGNGSGIIAGLKARGRTPQCLHISEWGPIACDDPKRSEEIETGAITAASGKDALIFAESTHKGGKGGDWYNLIKRSLETLPQHRTIKDFRVMFFPWWREKRYTLEGDVSQIDKETLAYFLRKEAEIGKAMGKPFQFTDGQCLFYFKEKERLKRKIYSEFPTTIEECWMAPIEGAIYGPEVDKARVSGRININVEYYESLPVYTAFDIGAPANTKCWIFQTMGDRINLLEALTGSDDCKTPAHWSFRLKEKPYRYATHFLPHDGAILWQQLLVDAGLANIVSLQKPLNIWDNINSGVDAFGRCWFNSIGCEDGINSLEAYYAKKETDGITIKDVPVHNWASHFSTAFGYIHQAIRLGMLVDRSAMPSKPRRITHNSANLTQVGASLTGIGRKKREDNW